MNFGKKTCWAALFALPSALCSPADRVGFACTAAQSVGFRYADGVWRPAQFTLSRYEVKPSREDASEWIVTELGRSYPIAKCGRIDAEGWLADCKGLHDVTFNARTLRFLVAYLYGSVNSEPGKENDDTPYLTIGTCSKM